MCLELIKDYPEEMDDMIACYCIGWALTKEDVEEYPQLVPASGLQLRGEGNYRFVLYSGGQLVI